MVVRVAIEIQSFNIKIIMSSAKNAGSNIKVAVRLRPVLPDEVKKGWGFCRDKIIVANNQVQIKNEKSTSFKSYAFDQVFDEKTNQADVYERTRIDYLIKQVVQGFHATIFVYGQTGSGKTFTMEGYKYESGSDGPGAPVLGNREQIVAEQPPNEGLIPRAIRDLFAQVQQRRQSSKGQKKITVRVQYIQLYNEKVYDLLNSTL